MEPDRRYTFLLVPDHGSGRVRQVSLSLSTLRRWALVGAVVIGLLISATLGLFRTLPRAWQFSALESENLVLKGELREIEAQLEDLEAVLRRLRLYDAQLQETTEAEQPASIVSRHFTKIEAHHRRAKPAPFVSFKGQRTDNSHVDSSGLILENYFD